MLEYFSYKKFKKNKEEKDAKEAKKDNGTSEADGNRPVANKDEPKTDDSSEPHADKAVLKPEDERFLEELLAQDTNGPAPPLPPRIYTYDVDWHSGDEASSIAESKKTTDDEKEDTAKKEDEAAKSADKADKAKEKKPNRLSLLFTRSKKPAEAPKPKASDSLKPDVENVTPKEAEREQKDLTRVLDRLSLSAQNNKVVSESKDSSADLLQRFTQVFKDLVNGVPTAYDDLTKLIEDRDGSINKLFDKLPQSLKKLVTQLPDKLTSTLAPELLAAAAESQGIKVVEGGVKGTAKRMLMGQNLADLVKRPGAIVGMLKAIVEVLKSRWPAFIGMNVIWSVALSLLLVVLWYCYKRGREERMLREAEEAGPSTETDSHRFEELSSDSNGDEPGQKNTEAAAEVIPVIITSPGGEQRESPAPEGASMPEMPRLDASEEQKRS
ncbi:hypothetical protein ACQKWADRAFT_294880 [Trichoderma austrokoningii]